uniref:Flavonoid 3'-monooxygenase n=1 Tax=Rhizophora mucronata TaxID=61149 RepID=A0A2P2MR43_RHIMU
MKSKRACASLPPGPVGLPIVGYLPFLFGDDLHQKFTELAEVYGPVYKFWLGKKLCVVVNSPSLAKEVVRDQDTTFAYRDPPIAAWILSSGGNDISWSAYGPDWKRLRKVFVSNMLSNAGLDATYALRKQAVNMAIRYVYKNIGKPVDLGELAFATNANAIMSILWGGTLEGEEGTKLVTEFRKSVLELMVLMGRPNISDYFPLLARLDLQGIEKQSSKATSRIREFLDTVIEKGSNLTEVNSFGFKKTERKKDFLQILLELKDRKDDSMSVTDIQLKGILKDIVIGGMDTTSTMVEWAMAELIQHQEMMEKVHQELDEVVGLNKMVEESHLPQLRYLQAVLEETLRLHPALPLLVPRRPSNSCKLGEYTIPSGSTVFLNAYAIHRDPQLWDRPLEFQPERFLCAESIKFDLSGNNFQYLPFGSGRRVCAGLPLAEKMLMYQLASFLHSFDWKLPGDTKLEFSEKSGIVVKKMKPLLAIPTPRLSDLDLYFQD